MSSRLPGHSKRRMFISVTVLSVFTGVSVYVYSRTISNTNGNIHISVYRAAGRETRYPATESPFVKSNQHALTQYWQEVGTTKDVYVFSAYYTEENDNKKIVQVIGIVVREIKVTCIFLSENNTEQGRVKGTLRGLPEDHREACNSSAAFIMCQLKTLKKPHRIGLRARNVTTYLQVIYTTPRRYNFTVCLSSLHGNYGNYLVPFQEPMNDPLKIIEMVEADRIFGADHFVVYNLSISREVDRVLWYYVRKGLMDVIPWNLPKVNVWYFGQLASIHDCILANRNKSKYIVQKDLDELIVPTKHRNWFELMAELDVVGSHHSAYVFRHAYFPLHCKPSANETKSWDETRLKLKSLVHIWREDPLVIRSRSKYIAHPERVVTSGVHFPVSTKSGYCDLEVDPMVALLHHYRDRPPQVTGRKDDRMLLYADKLIANVRKTLSELHLN